jgi:secreted trypsin-like serine protease
LKNAKYFEVPSEDQLLAMKRSNVPLTLIGYGTTSDTDANSSLLPSQISATYSSEWNATLTNTGYAQSSPGDTCSGDSGGPVIANYSGRSYVIGIITGAPPSINCTKAEAGGYFTSFTLINRYANILLMASNAALELEASSSISRNQANEAEISSLRNNLEQTRTQLDQANAEITRLKSKSITTITCIKGSLTKKISGVNPKCPTGYKKK